MTNLKSLGKKKKKVTSEHNMSIPDFDLMSNFHLMKAIIFNKINHAPSERFHVC